MLLPKDIVGKNRLRDLKICDDYCGDKTAIQIAEENNLSIQRIYHILNGNSKYVLENVGWSKSKRLKMLQKIGDNAGIELSPKKDILNVIEQMRKEKEGDGTSKDNSTHVHFVIFRNPKALEEDENRTKPRAELKDTKLSTG